MSSCGSKTNLQNRDFWETVFKKTNKPQTNKIKLKRNDIGSKGSGKMTVTEAERKRQPSAVA